MRSFVAIMRRCGRMRRAHALASKGNDAATFELSAPPAGFSCVLGAYTDH